MTHRVRLTKAERREQLLDTAARIIVVRNVGALTMESLAAEAGVSKALPYVHFTNAREVLIELYRREIGRLGARILAAVEGVEEPDAVVRGVVTAYFDAVAARGAILSVLTAPSAGIAEAADAGARVGHHFGADLMQRAFPMKPRQALAAATIALSVLAGAVESWARRDAGRAALEEFAVQAILALGRSGGDGDVGER